MTEIKTLTAGIHAGVPVEQYIRDPAPEPSLSTGAARAMLDECPARAWYGHPRLNPAWTEGENNAATDRGKIAHALLLEGGTEKICVINPEDYRSKPTKADPEGSIPKGWTNNAIKAARDTARANGLVPMLPWDHIEIKNMVEVAFDAMERAKADIGFSLSEMQAERTMIWQAEVDRADDGSCTKIWCRSRPDLLTPDFKLAIDYKTTATLAAPGVFARQIINMGYDLQGALIRDGIHTLCGWTPDVVFMVQETEPPYLCSFVGLSPTFAAIADQKLAAALKRWRDCLASNKWPGYPSQVAWVDPPAWEIARAEALGVTG